MNPLMVDDMIADAMLVLRGANPPMTPEALDVIDMVEEEIAERQGERIAACFARWLDEHPRGEPGKDA